MAPAVSSWIAEFVGTFFLVFTIGLNVLQNTPLAPVSIGLILMVMIFASGSVSGAHYNPAVTIGVWLTGRGLIKPADVGMYIVSQTLGGLAAGLLYSFLLDASFTLHPGAGFSMTDACATEVLFSLALVFVVLNTATLAKDSQSYMYMEFNGLAIGFTVMSAAFASGSISGCSLNPAVTFGISMSSLAQMGYTDDIRYVPLYFLCPFFGSVLAAVLFRFVVRRPEYNEQVLKLEHDRKERLSNTAMNLPS